MLPIQQGDICLIPINEIPDDALPVDRQEGEGIVIAEGEVTGHHHIVNGDATEYRAGRKRFLSVPEHASSTTLDHDEHSQLQVPAGNYEVRDSQREYAPPKPKDPPRRQRVSRVRD